jgi:hypothetical protein
MLFDFSFPSATSFVYFRLSLRFRRHAVKQSIKTAKAQIDTKGMVGSIQHHKAPIKPEARRVSDGTMFENESVIVFFFFVFLSR